MGTRKMPKMQVVTSKNTVFWRMEAFAQKNKVMQLCASINAIFRRTLHTERKKMVVFRLKKIMHYD
jgi:hypothetical protein